MEMGESRSLAIAIAMAAVSLPAQAATLFKLNGTGTISSSNRVDYSVGEAASLTFTFDADTADIGPVSLSGQSPDPFVGEIVGFSGPKPSVPGQANQMLSWQLFQAVSMNFKLVQVMRSRTQVRSRASVCSSAIETRS